MRAVILAAGKGERLQPLTSTRPKHLLQVGGKTLLQLLLEEILKAKIKEVLLVTHYMDDKIKEHFKDGSELGLEIRYVRQEKMNGTADAFSFCEDFVNDREFLGLYGDLHLSPGLLKNLIKNHKQGELTITGLERDPYLYGALELEGDRVLSIMEKPSPGTAPSNVTNAGIYVFPAEIFSHIKETKLSSRGEFEITESINKMIGSGVMASLYRINQSDWLDIGHPWNLLEANSRTLSRIRKMVEGKVEEGANLNGPVYVAPTARIRSGVYIEGPAYIGDGSDVGPNCYIRPSTTLCGNNRVGASCEIKNSILMKGAHVPHLSYVGDSIVGERCNLGAGTITANLRFDQKNIKMTIKNKRVDTGLRKLGCIFGDEVQTGINVSIHPGVKVGTKAWIAPGVKVIKDVSDGVILTAEGEVNKTD